MMETGLTHQWVDTYQLLITSAEYSEIRYAHVFVYQS